MRRAARPPGAPPPPSRACVRAQASRARRRSGRDTACRGAVFLPTNRAEPWACPPLSICTAGMSALRVAALRACAWRRAYATGRSAAAATPLERLQRWADEPLAEAAEGEAAAARALAAEEAGLVARRGGRRKAPGRNLLEVLRRLPEGGVGARVAEGSGHPHAYYQVTRVKLSPHEPAHGRVWGVKYFRGKLSAPNDRARPIKHVLRRPWVVRGFAADDEEGAPPKWVDMRERYDVDTAAARRSAEQALSEAAASDQQQEEGGK